MLPAIQTEIKVAKPILRLIKGYRLGNAIDLRPYLHPDRLFWTHKAKQALWIPFLGLSRKAIADFDTLKVLLPEIPALDPLGNPYPTIPQLSIRLEPGRFRWRVAEQQPEHALAREEHRLRRNEHKLGKGIGLHYMNIKSAVDRTYGKFDDWMDVSAAWQTADNLPDFFKNLAGNELVDRAIGYRAKRLKADIYDKEGYNLPVGLDFALSPFRR